MVQKGSDISGDLFKHFDALKLFFIFFFLRYEVCVCLFGDLVWLVCRGIWKRTSNLMMPI